MDSTMGKYDVRIVMPAHDAHATLPESDCALESFDSLVQSVENHLGSPLFVSIPQTLQSLGRGSSEMWETVDTLHTLKSLGIIRNFSRLPRYPDEPAFFAYGAEFSHTRYSSGADFLSETKAAWRTIGEAVERNLWTNSDFSKKARISTSHDLTGSALDIFSFAGFSKQQREDHRELQVTQETPFAWIPSISLTDHRETLVPLQLVSAHHWYRAVKTRMKKVIHEPMLRWSVSTGLATGRTQFEALVAGILEIIERDAFMLTWLNKLSPPKIDLQSMAKQDSDIDAILNQFKRYKLTVQVLSLPTDFPVFVFLALITDPTGRGPVASVGASADFDIKTCLLDALSESLIVRTGLKHSDTQPVELSHMGREERICYYARPENSEKLAFLTQGKDAHLTLPKKSLTREENRHTEEQLNTLVSAAKKLGCTFCSFELSSKETRGLGFHTFFVLSPELQPLHLEEAIPYLGGSRIKTVPEQLGYVTPKELNGDPHPFP